MIFNIYHFVGANKTDVLCCSSWPGLQLQCHSPDDQYELPVQYLGTAVRGPPTRCRSYNRSLDRQRQWELTDFAWKKVQLLTSITMFGSCLHRHQILGSTHLCLSCRNRCLGWFLSPPSGSPRWRGTWSHHKAAPCQSYTPSLFQHTEDDITLHIP